MKSVPVLASMMLAWLLSPSISQAQDSNSPLFDDAQAVVQIDFQRFRSTDLGKHFLEFVKQQAMSAIHEDGGDHAPSLESINELFGFDPFEEIRGVVIAVNELENPEDDLVGIIQLGSTTGNIEGLLLGLPGYSSEKQGGVTIHSADFDGKRIYGAIHTNGKNKTIIVAPDHERLAKAMKSVGEGLRFESSGKSSDESSFLKVTVNKLPEDMMDEGPPANIVKLIQSVEVTVGESGNNLTADLAITTDDEEHAKQLQQMAEGLRAMLKFAASQEEADEDLARMLEFTEGLKVASDGNRFRASLALPMTLVMELLKEEAGLPF